MALKYIGERAVGTLNGMKSGFVKDDLFRVYDGGILVPGGVSVDHGDFVSWNGTKWVKEVDIKIATNELVSESTANIAPEYNEYSQYRVGASVIYKGKFYTCKKDTSGEWDASCWSSSFVITAGYDVYNYNDTVRKQGAQYKINLVDANKTYQTFKLKNDGDAKLVINVGPTTDAIVHITAGVEQVNLASVKRDDNELTLIGTDGDITNVIDYGGCSLTLVRNGIGGVEQSDSCLIQILGNAAIFRFL